MLLPGTGAPHQKWGFDTEVRLLHTQSSGVSTSSCLMPMPWDTAVNMNEAVYEQAESVADQPSRSDEETYLQAIRSKLP
jgi:hypothetical protein